MNVPRPRYSRRAKPVINFSARHLFQLSLVRLSLGTLALLLSTAARAATQTDPTFSGNFDTPAQSPAIVISGVTAPAAFADAGERLVSISESSQKLSGGDSRAGAPRLSAWPSTEKLNGWAHIESHGQIIRSLPADRIPIRYGSGLRRTALMGLTGAVAGALAGGAMELVDPHGKIADVWPVLLAIPGFIGGVVFSVVVPVGPEE